MKTLNISGKNFFVFFLQNNFPLAVTGAARLFPEKAIGSLYITLGKSRELLIAHQSDSLSIFSRPCNRIMHYIRASNYGMTSVCSGREYLSERDFINLIPWQ